MKYKVGDRVKIKSNDFFNKNKCNLPFYVDSMALCFSNEIVTIKSHGRYPNTYRILEDEGDFLWTDEMIECKVEEEVGTASNPIEPKSNANSITQNEVDVIEKAKTYWDSIKDAWICPEGYQFVDENGNVINAQKIVLEKKKKEYPKTYEECCKVLGINSDNFLSIRNLLQDDGNEETIDYEGDLLDKFNSLWELLICRDVYWKIAGDEMGLGKPWEPDIEDDTTKYTIVYTNNDIEKDWEMHINHILSFPTREIRDTFYENFKELIESCKELL